MNPENCLSRFLLDTYVVGTHWKRLDETLPVNANSICFRTRMRKVSLFFSVEYVGLILSSSCTLVVVGLNIFEASKSHSSD